MTPPVTPTPSIGHPVHHVPPWGTQTTTEQAYLPFRATVLPTPDFLKGYQREHGLSLPSTLRHARYLAEHYTGSRFDTHVLREVERGTFETITPPVMPQG